jgi:hypothetical protein
MDRSRRSGGVRSHKQQAGWDQHTDLPGWACLHLDEVIQKDVVFNEIAATPANFADTNRLVSCDGVAERTRDTNNGNRERMVDAQESDSGQAVKQPELSPYHRCPNRFCSDISPRDTVRRLPLSDAIPAGA